MQKKLSFRQRLKIFGLVTLLPLWTFVAVFVIGGGLGGMIIQLMIMQLGVETVGDSSLAILLANTVVYVIGLAALLIEPYSIRRLNKKQIQQELGVAKRPTIRDAGVAIVGWAGYFIATLITTAFFVTYVPFFDIEQNQPIGFATNGGTLDTLFAFVAIVVIAPIVEELIFRGYLQGNLRKYIPWWGAAIITGVLFGAAHGQWNVAVDTFVLSMVACYLRERTGAIWAGVGLHALKNAIAFMFLFLLPKSITDLLG